MAAVVCALAALAGAMLLSGAARTALTTAGAAAAVAFAVAAALVPHDRAARDLRAVIGDNLRAGEQDLARAHSDIGTGRNRDAGAALDSAEAAFRRAAARDGLARIELARGDLERLQGRLDEAKAHYAQAAGRLTALGHRDAPVALLRQGEMDAALGEVESARKSFAFAIAGFRRTGQDLGEAQALLADGVVLRMAGAFADAAAELTAADALFAKAGDLLGRGRATLELARIAQGLVHRSEGAHAAEAAAGYFQAAGSAFGLVVAPIPAAEAAIEDEERDAAIAGFERAADAFARLADPVAAAAQYLGLSSTGTLSVTADTGKADAMAAAANLAAFPDHHSEARALVAAVATQIERGRFNAQRVQ